MGVKHKIAALLMAAAGIVASLALVPRSEEIALQNWKDKQFDVSLQIYESEYARGNRSARVVGALAQAYVQFGEMDHAIRILEGHLQTHPADREVRLRLGTYYQYAQLRGKYLDNLEQLVSGSATEAQLRELSRGYNFLRQYDKQITALSRLAKRPGAKAEDFRDLAQMQAAVGQLQAAAETLTGLAKSQPESIDGELAELYVKLLLDTGQSERATEEASRWIARRRDWAAAARIVIHFRPAHASAGLAVLNQLGSAMEQSPVLLALRTGMEVDGGQRSQAFAQLEALQTAGRLPANLLETYVDLALFHHQFGLAKAAIPDPERLPNPPLSSWLIANLAQSALKEGEQGYALRAAGRLGNSIGERYPVLAIQLALARNDRKGALDLMVAQSRQSGAGEQVLLDTYYLSAALAETAVQLAVAGQLLARAKKLNADIPEARRRVSEARLAALQRGVRSADQWLPWAREELADPATNQAAREAWISAMVAAKAYAPALPHLKRLAEQQGETWSFAYMDALRALDKRTDLAAFLDRELRRPNLPAKDYESRLYALLELKDMKLAIPHLRKQVHADPERWGPVYEDALRTMPGGRDELVNWWRERSANAATTEARRGAAFRLLEIGLKPDAVTAFWALANEAEAQSPDVAELLYLWGPRPSGPALEWMERRARQAASAEKVRWMDILVLSGAPARALRVAESGADPSLLGERYWRAVQSTRDLPKFRAVLSAAITAAKTGEPLRTLARLALEENEQELSQRAFGRLLEIEPKDREALEQIGRSLYASGRRTLALSYFERLRAGGGSSWEADWLSAEVLGHQGNVRQGALLLRSALMQIDRELKPDPAMRAARPQILFRLGRIAESREAWEALMRERPDDLNVRADYVAMLIEQRSFDRARQVLHVH